LYINDRLYKNIHLLVNQPYLNRLLNYY